MAAFTNFRLETDRKACERFWSCFEAEFEANGNFFEYHDIFM